jgi:hypothetical protein
MYGQRIRVGPVGLEPTTHGLKVLSLREENQSLSQNRQVTRSLGVLCNPPNTERYGTDMARIPFW